MFKNRAKIPIPSIICSKTLNRIEVIHNMYLYTKYTKIFGILEVFQYFVVTTYVRYHLESFLCFAGASIQEEDTIDKVITS